MSTRSGWRSQEIIFDGHQKAQEHPFILPFYKIDAVRAHLSWFRDWQGLGHTLCDSTASGGVAGGKSNYILCSIFPSAFFSLSYKP